jgi:DNA (cytosine-5)-methyltransferase 1
MKANQLNLFGDELIVDNFAGGGGASEGIEQALARAVDIAINHDADALAMHKENHPDTHHLCDDVFKVDPRKVCNGYRVGAAWFSPDCKDFSKAKGGKPVSKKIRGLAWVMVKWAVIKRPRVLFLENVEEFKDWGPLRKDGKRCPERKGKTFRNFCTRLRNLGYEVDHRELRACDYGAPTSRKRLFLIARCDGSPIVWPAPTHGKPGSPDVESGKIKPWRTAAECIDFSLPCPSIFLTKRGAKKLKLKVIRPLAPATMRRIARGIFKFVIENPKPFIVKVNHTGYDQFRGQSIDEPLQTITTKHPYAVVSPHITKFRTGATGSKVDDPLPTITAGPKENPAGAAHAMGMVAATLVPRYGEREGQAPRAMRRQKPMPTIVPITKTARHSSPRSWPNIMAATKLRAARSKSRSTP